MNFRADLVLAWRRLLGDKLASIAAIVSLAIGTGAVLAAFQLVHALLFRPLPIAAPERLHALSYQQLDPGSGVMNRRDNWQYPLFREMRSAVSTQAKLLALSGTERVEIELQAGQQFEKSQLQYVSGDMFEVFGLRPALGRLFDQSDDLQVGAHPVAVISHGFWSHRFSRDPYVLGRTFRVTNNLTGTRIYEIVGVAPDGFTGAEPGKAVDIFLPSVMHWAMAYPNWSPFRTFAHLHRDAEAAAVRDRLDAVVRAWEESEGGSGARTPRTVELLPASAGVSAMQARFRPSLA
jgi:putative ABC transport system permease protein